MKTTPAPSLRSVKRNTGASLALTLAAVFVLLLVGIGAFYMHKIFAGARELQALTDSGNLNLGKEMVATGVPPLQSSQQVTFQYMYYPYWGVGPGITGVWQTPGSASLTIPNGIEGSAFAYLTDANASITLQNYNRVIAQTMLIGLNAAAENTLPATANAQTLFNQVQLDSNSLSERLQSKLSDPTVASPIFLNTASLNSLRMLGTSATPTFQPNTYTVSYNSPGQCTNVWIDPSILPQGTTMPAGSLSTVVSPSNFPYLTGYTDIDTGTFTIQGTPVFPGQQPHLISLRDSAAGLTPPVQSGYVAPNAFQASSSAMDGTSNSQLTETSAAVVGTLAAGYPASIPEGYVVILNTVGSLSGTLPQIASALPAAESAAVIAQVTQRLREIAPTMSSAQILTFLNNTQVNPLPNGPTYIYLYPDPNNALYAAWYARLVAAGGAVGTPGQLYASTIPPPTYIASNIETYSSVIPDGLLSRNFAPNYEVDWSPSSGFANLLGLLVIP